MYILRKQAMKEVIFFIILYNITSASFYIYIRRLDDKNVQACACDSLYRTITKFSFLLF